MSLENRWVSDTVSYLGKVRRDLIEPISHGPNYVLDVGCGQGETGKILKEEGKAAFMAGIELSPDAAKVATQYLDLVLCGDACSILHHQDALPRFDYILLGDVLEHVTDPWELLMLLRRFLKPKGYLILTTPNIRHWRVIIELLIRGDWRYRGRGVFDYTHLRFFTKRSLKRILAKCGYDIDQAKVSYKYGPRARILNRLTFGLFQEFLCSTIFVEIQPRRGSI